MLKFSHVCDRTAEKMLKMHFSVNMGTFLHSFLSQCFSCLAE